MIKIIKNYTLALQHVLAMFGSTVLVPYITGMDTSLALLCAGIGTLIFHLCTKKIVPVFLGSSFAFIPVIILTLTNYDIGYLKGGVIIAGLVYLALAIFVKIYGSDRISNLLPAIVVGPIVISIGLKLVPIGLSMSGYSEVAIDYQALLLATISLLTMVFVSFLYKSFFRFMPIICAIIVGYLFALITGQIDLSSVENAQWFGLSSVSFDAILTLPKFNLSVVILIAPIALVTFLEHIGDIKTNGSVVGKDFFKNPGVHRTLLGDGFATMVSGFIGGPPNTTYGENTGVLAATRNYDPKNLRIAAVFAILLAFCNKIVVLLQTLPTAIMGGISLMLFGLIASIGLRIIVESKIDFNNYKNLVIPAIVIIVGVFVGSVKITENFVLSGLFLATIIGIILNKILPNMK